MVKKPNGKKKTFSLNMDKDLIKWVEKMVDEKIFRDRNHGIEFCVALVSRLPDETLVRLIFAQNKFPVFLPDDVRAKLEKVMNLRGLSSLEETIKYCLNPDPSIK